MKPMHYSFFTKLGMWGKCNHICTLKTLKLAMVAFCVGYDTLTTGTKPIVRVFYSNSKVASV